MFYRYRIAMKNDMNDVVVALKVVHEPYREVEWKIHEDERQGRETFVQVTKHLKNWCGDKLFAVKGSCFVNFDEDQLVQIGIRLLRSALYAAHNISRGNY